VYPLRIVTEQAGSHCELIGLISFLANHGTLFLSPVSVVSKALSLDEIIILAFAGKLNFLVKINDHCLWDFFLFLIRLHSSDFNYRLPM
jgi:hypothetical protein